QWSMNLNNSKIKIGYYQNVVEVGNVFVEANNLSLTGTIKTISDAFGIYSLESDFIIENAEMTYNGMKIDSKNYSLSFAEFRVEIVKSSADFSIVNEGPYVYDGTPKMMTFDMSNVTGEYTIFYSLIGGKDMANYSDVEFINAGKYTIYYWIKFENYADALGSFELVIEKATPSFEFETPSLTYTGLEVSLLTSDFSSDSNGLITYEFYDMDGNKLSSAPVNAGQYMIVFYIAETDNYKAARIEKQITITPVVLDVYWTNDRLEYTGMYQTPTYSMSVSNEVLGARIIQLSGDGIVIGKHKVQIVITNTNYVLSEDTMALEYEITPIQVRFPEEIVVSYTGSIPMLNANVPYIYLNNIHTEIGTYDLQIELTDLVNYQWSDGSDQHVRTITLRIVEKDITDLDVSYARMQSQNYTGKAIEPNVVIIYKGYRLVKGLDFVVTYTNNIEVFSNAIVTIEGIGNFTGTIEDTFFITSNVLKLDDSSDYKFVQVTGDRSYEEEEVHANFNKSGKTLLTNVKSGTTISDFLNNFIEAQRDYIKVYNGTKKVSASKYGKTLVGTGMKIVFTNEFGSTIDTVYVSILGDVNGDGNININDSSAIMTGINKNSLIEEFYFAADVNKDGTIDINDISLVNQHTNGSYNIE
ncbi:MAG: dockerin type I repeat-containing protein, partial [Anaeroplasmataceae bacterium]|nr:dockerin type I repeat-containing protein [Anaeroplasmataceae bacterium]